MKLANCSQCGNIYVENPAKLCANCLQEEEIAEDKVADFLRDVKNASLEDIHKATGVKHNVILRMLKRGRIVSNAIINYPCETCGAPITEGRVCDNCSRNIVGQMKVDGWQPKPKSQEASKRDEKMHIQDLLRKR